MFIANCHNHITSKCLLYGDGMAANAGDPTDSEGIPGEGNICCGTPVGM